ncbi:MAG: tetratricopeptide repeat protein [Archangium sp.]
MRTLALLCVVLGVGCAHVPECTAHGGRVWNELKSGHFTMRSDADEHVAKKTILELERVHAALQGTFTASPTTPLQVVLFRDGREFGALDGSEELESGFSFGPRGELTVLAGEGFLADERVHHRAIARELSRRFAAWSHWLDPWWLSEGIGAYFESAATDPELNTALLGSASYDYTQAVRMWGLLPLEDIWAPRTSIGPRTRHHRTASAWLWVHFFFNAESGPFRRFLDDLQNGAAAREAFDRQFAHLKPAQLELKAKEYLRVGNFETQFLVTPPMVKTVSQSVVAPATVHATLARVAAIGSQREVARQLAHGRDLDANDAEVLVERIWASNPKAAEFPTLVALLTTQHPEDARGWFFSSLVADADVALEKAISLDPTLWQALSARALLRGDLELAQQAVRFAPWNGRVLWTLGTVLARRGECAAAAKQYRLAKSVVNDGELPAEEACTQR